SDVFSSMATGMRGSAGRLTRMARQGDRVSVLKLAALVFAAGVALYYLLGWLF
ncbi:hypothetical protein KEM52_004545, partial [Ascosphaera acerosa]